MATTFPPPPTYADVVLVDEVSKKPRFNPLWLKWFLDVSQFITANGGGTSTINHNSTAGLQGGGTTERYHLTALELTNLLAGVFAGGVTSGISTYLLSTSASLSNGAGALTGTLTNSPKTGNPTKWIAINDNGTVRYVPSW